MGDLVFWIVAVMLLAALLSVVLDDPRLDDEPPNLDTRGPDDR